MNHQDRRSYSFGTYCLDTYAATLSRAGESVPLRGKAFEVLCYFVRHPGEVVKKEDLRLAVWRNPDIIENNVHRQVSNLRKVLGKTSDNQEYIETVHGDGYLFAVDVQVNDIPELPDSVLTTRVKTAVRSNRYRLIVTTLVVVALIATWFFIGHTRSRAQNNEPENTPEHPLFVQGMLRLALGSVPEAEAILEREIRREPDFGPAHAAFSSSLLSLGYEMRGREEAKKAWTLLRGLDQEHAWFVKGQYYESTLDWMDATKAFETLHALAPENLEWALRYSLALCRVGRQKDASKVVEKVSASDKVGQFSLRTETVEASVAESANDYVHELNIAEIAEKKAKSAGLPYQAGHAELSEAWALDNLSKLGQAEDKGTEAQHQLIKIGDKGGVAQAWKLLGDVYTDQKRLQLARSAYEQAVMAFKEIGWPSGEAIALNNYGYALLDLGDLQGARDLFGQSLSISRSLGNLRAQGWALNGAAIVLKRMGNLSGAADAYSSAIEIAKQLGDEGSLATRLNNLGIVQQDEGKLSEARRSLRLAMNSFVKLRRQADVAMVLGNFGDLEIKEGDLSLAEKDYLSDVKLAKLLSDPHNLAFAFIGLGEVYFLTSNLKSARGYLNRSLKIREALHEADSAAETTVALAEIDLEEKDFKAAGAKAKKAAATFALEQERDQEAVALAIVAESLVGEQQLTDALSAADSSVKLLAASEDVDSRMSAKLHLWKVFAATNQHSEALETLQSVYSDAERSKYIANLLKARLLLAEIGPRSSNAIIAEDLTRIQREADAKDLLLIAHQASEAKTAMRRIAMR